MSNLVSVYASYHTVSYCAFASVQTNKVVVMNNEPFGVAGCPG